jgi:hypothetical protein
MKLKKVMCLASAAVLLSLGMNQGLAQERQRGNFDPEEFRQRMNERLREVFEVQSDDEWKVIEPRLNKVMEARQGAMVGGFGGMAMMFGGGRRGGDGGGRRGGLGQQQPEMEDLRNAIENKASSSELKAAIEKVRAARKEREANLKKAQQELREVLSARQEAQAILFGFLD